jgi:hypothetical protein
VSAPTDSLARRRRSAIRADSVVEGPRRKAVEVVQIGGRDRDPEERGTGSVSEIAEYPLVLVTWRDAWFDFEEPDPEDVRTDYLVSTVGFLVRKGARFLSVAQEILPDGDGFRAVTHIPVAVVETTSPLRGLDDAATIDRLAR